MWIVSGPTSTVPLCGDGIEASKVTRQRILPVGRKASSENDAEREFERTAAPEQVDRTMEIDVVPCSDLGRILGRVAGAFQFLGSPGLDQRVLVDVTNFCGRHL